MNKGNYGRNRLTCSLSLSEWKLDAFVLWLGRVRERTTTHQHRWRGDRYVRVRRFRRNVEQNGQHAECLHVSWRAVRPGPGPVLPAGALLQSAHRKVPLQRPGK